jgi:DNA-directed RNA polymerase sigma subunit (sigma70/sigma32)
MAEPTETKLMVDVGVLKSQVSTLTDLCRKMDTVIDKLIDQHDKHIVKVYDTMDSRRLETEADIKEIHDRIDTVLTKMQDTELRIMTEIKGLRSDMSNHNSEEKKQLESILQWKWMIAGGMIVVSWLISHGTELMKIVH